MHVQQASHSGVAQFMLPAAATTSERLYALDCLPLLQIGESKLHCAGWCIWVFVIVAGAMLLAVNTHLMAAARLTGRGEGATVQQMPLPARLLASQLLLPVLKFLLFFVSFVFSNALFFATQFGSRSCFFSTYGFQGYPVPWWVSTLSADCRPCVSLPYVPMWTCTSTPACLRLRLSKLGENRSG